MRLTVALIMQWIRDEAESPRIPESRGQFEEELQLFSLLDSDAVSGDIALSYACHHPAV